MIIAPALVYIFDAIVVAMLISALGNEELDAVTLFAFGVATALGSLFFDLMLEHQFGMPGFFSACLVTALALGAALKLMWDVEFKRIALICIFFCAYHFGALRLVWLQ
jgi:acid phosphatase family membrane protein YuiD